MIVWLRLTSMRVEVMIECWTLSSMQLCCACSQVDLQESVRNICIYLLEESLLKDIPACSRGYQVIYLYTELVD